MFNAYHSKIINAKLTPDAIALFKMLDAIDSLESKMPLEQTHKSLNIIHHLSNNLPKERPTLGFNDDFKHMYSFFYERKGYSIRDTFSQWYNYLLLNMFLLLAIACFKSALIIDVMAEWWHDFVRCILNRDNHVDDVGLYIDSESDSEHSNSPRTAK